MRGLQGLGFRGLEGLGSRRPPNSILVINAPIVVKPCSVLESDLESFVLGLFLEGTIMTYKFMVLGFRVYGQMAILGPHYGHIKPLVSLSMAELGPYYGHIEPL